MEKHFATLWEAVADAIGDHEALVTGATRRTWSEYEDSARTRKSASTSGTATSTSSRSSRP